MKKSIKETIKHIVNGWEQSHSEQRNMSEKVMKNTQLYIPSYNLRSYESFRSMFVKYWDTSTLGRNAIFIKGLT